MLELRALDVTYGGIRAVRGASLAVEARETVALVGANGAGKSSTLRAIARLHDAAGGDALFEGRSLLRLPPHALVRAGIALVPEGRGVFPRLTVAENLAMGAYWRSNKPAVAADLDEVHTHFPRLAERAGQLAGTLSGGEQQMLAIGRAMMSRPRLLLLDEPSMGLAPLMVQKIFEVIAALGREGMTILLVEQNARLALEVSQRAYVMESGEITHGGRSSDLLADPRVRAAYLGE